MSLRKSAGLSEASLLDNAIRIKISCACTFRPMSRQENRVFGACDQIMLKLVCSATETHSNRKLLD